MEDLLKFLLIAGIIGIGIFKEASKSKSKKANNKRPASSTPIPPVSSDTNPLPEAWGQRTFLDELIRPAYAEQQTSKTKENRNKKTHVASTSMGTYAQNLQTIGSEPLTSPSSPTIVEEEKEDFTIHTVEEARRAIIWGEIFQRKY